MEKHIFRFDWIKYIQNRTRFSMIVGWFRYRSYMLTQVCWVKRYKLQVIKLAMDTKTWIPVQPDFLNEWLQRCRNPMRKWWSWQSVSVTYKMRWVWWATMEVASIARRHRRYCGPRRRCLQIEGFFRIFPFCSETDGLVTIQKEYTMAMNISNFLVPESLFNGNDISSFF